MAGAENDQTILNAFTVDVEEHFQVTAFAGVVNRDDWDSHTSRVEANTDRLLDLLSETGVKATFFTLGWIAERYPRLIHRIAELGHEIGCHGFSHTLVYDQDAEEFREETVRAKKILEDVSGREVRGYRAASFSITRKNLWALDVLVESGFRYDSSLFPVYHDLYGIPGAPRGIYDLVTPGGNGLTEAPPSTLRLGPVALPVAGGAYLRLFPRAFTRWAIGRLNRREKKPAIVYVHPWEVDPAQPKIVVPWKSRFRHYSRLNSTAGKVRGLLERFRFGSLSEVLARRTDSERLKLS